MTLCVSSKELATPLGSSTKGPVCLCEHVCMLGGGFQGAQDSASQHVTVPRALRLCGCLCVSRDFVCVCVQVHPQTGCDLVCGCLVPCETMELNVAAQRWLDDRDCMWVSG